MKGSWVTSLAVGSVVLLLTLFLGLQYNWQKQASDAERERMQKRVETDTKNFADDFNREIQAAYFNFQTDADSWKRSDWTEFNERYDYWKEKTQYPDLIRDFVFFGKSQNETLRYNLQKRSFETAEAPEELRDLRVRFEDEDSFDPFYEDAFVLVMPVHEAEKRFERILIRQTKEGEAPVMKMPVRHGYLVIVLDHVVINQILQGLAEKYFGDGDFRLDVKNKSEAAVFRTADSVSFSDAKASLLDLSPDNMIFFADRGIFTGTERKPNVLVNQRIESHTFSRTETRSDGTHSGTFKIELKPGDAQSGEKTKTRTSVIAGTSNDNDPWMLNVQHVSGSIDSFIAGERNKSFAIGLGVYFLLVGAIVAIVLSALRSKRFAQQQIDFVSSVSHEFRTPLSVIYSASENLADGVTKDEAQVTRYGNLIKGEGRKLSSMVEQILAFAGAHSGRKKYNFTRTDVVEVVKEALAECAPLLEAKGFEVETAFDENLPPVKADAEALSSAMQNLIQNSVKYSNGTKWIRVSADQLDGRIKLSVKDRGIGVAGNDIWHIFEPFYRAKDVVDAQIHGNGLGLALVKEIAEAHGGTIRAKSDIGKGSEFTIEIPQA
ncbi:MAG: HAMP domain-containing sensor histidine kinase [Pyrinomonadaceae bacterium]